MFSSRLNPLHCGAVVASSRRRARSGPRRAQVSIPFIAGQWSLLRSWTRPPMRRPGFNPLHCGAVVASFRRRGCGARRQRVSIPFIAGQWSLLHGRVTGPHGEVWFQSPSLRGSGRFSEARRDAERRCAKRFNPLHCGAVVASWSVIALPPTPDLVSIPFIAGQWSLLPQGPFTWNGTGVSIPFIAGQWSLPPAKMR